MRSAAAGDSLGLGGWAAEIPVTRHPSAPARRHVVSRKGPWRIVRLTAFPTPPSWFVVLPDCDTAAPLASALRGRAPQQLDHPSGRPWLMGRWASVALATGRAGHTAVAVIGQHARHGGDLADIAGSIRSIGDVDRLVRGTAGSVHVAASVDGDVRVQGTLTGVRRLYQARSGGVTCAADRADVLAWLLNTSLDEGRLAVHLLEPPIVYPLAGAPVWKGVEAVPTDHYLALAADGSYRHVRRWSPPPADVPLVDGAAQLREALTASVAARAAGRSLVSCDLGGVDSTAVCCVAAATVPLVVAYTAASPDPLADDVDWAKRTAARCDTIEHHVIPAHEMPLVYHGSHEIDEAFDEPCSVTVDRDRWLIIATRAAARGSDLHLVGFGGDELLYGSLAHVRDMLRTHPRIAAGHLRGFTAKYRWSRRRVLRQLADRRPYAAWLAGVADVVATPAPPPEEPLLAWGFEPRLPPWVTPEAAAAVRDLIRADAVGVEPLAPTRGQHRELETMRFVSRIARQLEQMAARHGIMLAAPYYDDAVVEAGLAVRPYERITPWRYKPLIAEAMRGIVPEESRTRQTKANGTVDEEPGLRRHRADVLALWDGARLGRLGLVDVDALRSVCAGPLPAHLSSGALYQTIACEAWLRTLDGGIAT